MKSHLNRVGVVLAGIVASLVGAPVAFADTNVMGAVNFAAVRTNFLTAAVPVVGIALVIFGACYGPKLLIKIFKAIAGKG